MPTRPQFFVKSLEEDFYTKTLRGKRKVNFQSVGDMITSKRIRPNTKSFGQAYRLSTTILHPNYLKTYRSQGIIFQTSDRPAYVLPFDLVLLSNARKIIVHYFRIKNSLHVYYNHELIPGFEKFFFKNIEALTVCYPTLAEVWKEVNRFRKKAGFKVLPRSKYRLIEYDEAVFQKPIRIRPIAIFGYSPLARRIARTHRLPHFRTAKDFYRKTVSSRI